MLFFRVANGNACVSFVVIQFGSNWGSPCHSSTTNGTPIGFRFLLLFFIDLFIYLFCVEVVSYYFPMSHNGDGVANGRVMGIVLEGEKVPPAPGCGAPAPS